jgi:hypothetical protein
MRSSAESALLVPAIDRVPTVAEQDLAFISADEDYIRLNAKPNSDIFIHSVNDVLIKGAFFTA